MSTIERQSPIPLYYQLKQLLSERIVGGDWRPGDMLPTEEQLQEQYQLSRTTVRQALRELELEGQISRHRGRGTFVSRPKITHNPDPHFSLTEVLLAQGVRPGWQVLSADWIPAPSEVAERLAVEVGAKVYRLRRLRLTNDEAIGYHVAHVTAAAAMTIDQDQLAQGGSLDYLRQSGYLADSYANRTIEAILASDEIGRLLDVERGSPILLIRRQLFTGSGNPVEDLRAMYRGDRFRYHIQQKRET